MADAPDTTRLTQRLFFALLYFSEGAPIGYIWWAMPTRLREAGMPVEQVGALVAMLTLPWALKFLWAPAVDRLRGPRWGYRAWITTAQLAMGLTLLPIALLPAEEIVGIATWLLLAHAISAATQDVSIDALAIATISERERGRITGWMQAGMLVGRGVFGGLALVAENKFGPGPVVFALIGCVWITLLVVWLTPFTSAERAARELAREPIWPHVRLILGRRSTWLGLGVALIAGAGFEATAGLMGPFLIDQGVESEDVGWFFALPVIACMILGGLAGGWLADRIGHQRVVRASVLAVALSVSAIVAVDAFVGIPGAWLMAPAGALYLCIGSLTASSYALFMDLTDPALGGTQFSAYMGITNLCEVWAVAMAGRIAGVTDYGLAFMVAATASLVALPLVSAIVIARPEKGLAQGRVAERA